jgi:hypothetical protein
MTRRRAVPNRAHLRSSLFVPLLPEQSRRDIAVERSRQECSLHDETAGYIFVTPRLTKTRFSNGFGTERQGQNSWSGAILDLERGSPPFSNAAKFTFVRARWTIPNVALPDIPSVFQQTAKSEAAQGFFAACSTWVGFNGSQSVSLDPAKHPYGGLWQGGAQTNIQISSGSISTYVWFQVLGSRGTGPELDLNFDASPGDLLDVSIEDITATFSRPESLLYQGGARCTYINHTRQTFTKFEFFCDFPVEGRQVEWIVERPGVNNGLAWLPRFGSVFFSNAECRYMDDTVTNVLAKPGDTPAPLAGRNISKLTNQVDSNNNVLTACSIPVPGIVCVNYTYGAG